MTGGIIETYFLALNLRPVFALSQVFSVIFFISATFIFWVAVNGNPS
jgi:hypothetical protein